MRKILLGSIFLFSISGFAYEGGIVAGIRQTEVEFDADNVDSSGGIGLQLGVVGFMELQGNFWGRGGCIYTNRKFELKNEASGIKDEVTFSYIDIPLTVLYLFNEQMGVFAGPEIGFRIGDSNSRSGTSDNFDYGSGAKSTIYGLSLGGHFRFTPNMGLEAAYTVGLSDVWKDNGTTVEKASGLAASFLYLF